MLNLPPLPANEGEPQTEYHVRRVRAARRERLRAVRHALGEVTYNEGPLYQAVAALTEIVDDLIERNFL
jgi:hypothetical protein